MTASDTWKFRTVRATVLPIFRSDFTPSKLSCDSGEAARLSEILRHRKTSSAATGPDLEPQNAGNWKAVRSTSALERADTLDTQKP